MTTITCPYSLTVVGGQSVASLQALMAAVPIDFALPQMYGLRLTADSIGAVGQVITRTLTFSASPSVVATASLSLVPGNGSGSPLDSVGSITPGAGYAGPPIIATSSGTAPNKPAQLVATMELTDVLIIKGGAGYTGATRVDFVGGQLAPGGVQATASVTVEGGAVTAITPVTPGGPYNVPPTVVISDVGGGAGAVGSAGLGVSGIDIVYVGMGYVPAAPPGLAFTPIFDSRFLSGSDRASSLRNFMKSVFEEFLDTPVFGLEPVVS
jgi:hypothetical protein